MFCGCDTTFGAAAQQPGLPDLPRPARLAAGPQRRRGRVDDPDRAGARLRHRHLVPVRAQELLLPGHAEELPDLAVRRADLHRRPPRGRGRDRRRAAHLPDRDRARAHGGGHRQVAARRRRDRSHPRCRPLARRLQPGRHPADRDRHQAGRGHRRTGAAGGPRLRDGAARADAHPGCLRRTDGAGLAALRRQPLAAALAVRPAGHPVRDEERQLAALGRAGDAVRDPPAGRAAVGRRTGRAGDPALARGHRHHDVRPFQGAGRGLPVLPRARPRPRRAGAGLGRGAAGRAAGRARGTASRAAGRVGRLGPRHEGAGQRRRRRPRRERRSPPVPRPRPPASGGWASWRARPTSARSTSPRSRSPRRRSRGWWRSSSRAR